MSILNKITHGKSWKVKHWATSNHRYAYRINADMKQESDEEAEANRVTIEKIPEMLSIIERLAKMTLTHESFKEDYQVQIDAINLLNELNK